MCPNCGHSNSIFGTGGAQRLSAELDVDMLGNVQIVVVNILY